MELTLLSLGIIIDAAFIIIDHKYHNWLSIVLKTLAAFFFCALGSYELIKTPNQKLGIFILIALIFDLFGDFLLILRNIDKKHKDLIFISGTFSFLISHIILLIFMLRLNESIWLMSTITGLVLFVITAIPFLTKIKTSKKLKIVGAIYYCFIIYGFTYALCNMVNVADSFSVLFLIGYFLFMVSDIVLIFQKFGNNPPACLQPIYRVLYYISQVIIAISIKLLK